MTPPKPDAVTGLRLPVLLDADRRADDRRTGTVVLALFDECAPQLRRYVGSFGLAADAADDVVQDVFLALFRHVAQGRPRHNLRGWVFRVAHNLALKQRSRDRLRGATPVDTTAERLDPDGDPEAQLAERQRQRRLRQVLDALPERDRQCVLLRAEGLRYREIARVVGVSLGTVAATLARVYARLEVEGEA